MSLGGAGGLGAAGIERGLKAGALEGNKSSSIEV